MLFHLQQQFWYLGLSIGWYRYKTSLHSEWMWVCGTTVMGVWGASHLQVGLVKVNEISWFQKGSFSETASGPIRVRMLWLSDRSLTWLVFAPIAPGNHQRLPQSLIISRAKPGGSWEKYMFIRVTTEVCFSVTSERMKRVWWVDTEPYTHTHTPLFVKHTPFTHTSLTCHCITFPDVAAIKQVLKFILSLFWSQKMMWTLLTHKEVHLHLQVKAALFLTHLKKATFHNNP